MGRLNYAKVGDVKSPIRAHPSDAGIDFFIPNDWNNKMKYYMYEGESVLIPSGIKMEIPRGYMGVFLNKSSVASQQSLLVGAQVIDAGYIGEIHIDLHNVGDIITPIIAGDKIAQMVIVPIGSHLLNEIQEEEFTQTKRGTNGFGSTGGK